MDGCPAGSGGGKLLHLKWTILNFTNTIQEKLASAGHQGGPNVDVLKAKNSKPWKTSGFVDCGVSKYKSISSVNKIQL